MVLCCPDAHPNVSLRGMDTVLQGVRAETLPPYILISSYRVNVFDLGGKLAEENS